MASIINALSDLFKSVVELFWSFFTTAGALVQKTGQFAIKFATEILDLVVSFFRGLVDLAGGLVSFLFGKSQQQAVPGAVRANGRNRQHPHARSGRRSGVWFPAVPAQPRQAGYGRQQEAELVRAIPPGLCDEHCPYNKMVADGRSLL